MVNHVFSSILTVIDWHIHTHAHPHIYIATSGTAEGYSGFFFLEEFIYEEQSTTDGNLKHWRLAHQFIMYWLSKK